MDIILYQNISENNRIGKTLINAQTFTGNLRQSTSIINPVIMLNADNPTVYNYAYIPAFNRYYFINKIEAYRTGLFILTMSVDVLETYKKEIKGMLAIIEKNETVGNNYFNDGSFVLDSRAYNQIINFSNGFNDNGNFILITAGA